MMLALSSIELQHTSFPSVIVIGGGISGISAARTLHDANFKVMIEVFKKSDT